MKRTAFAALMVGLVVLAGCIPCLRAICTEKDLVFEPALVGTWHQADSKGVWRFAKAHEKTYRLVVTDRNGKPGEFSAHLAKIGDTLFLDLCPEKPDPRKNDFYMFYLRPTHTFFLVREIAGVLRLSFMNPKWLQNDLKANPEALRHEQTDQGILLTASTEELQAFLVKHVQTKDAWSDVPPMKKETP